jgi:hypothetical protein
MALPAQPRTNKWLVTVSASYPRRPMFSANADGLGPRTSEDTRMASGEGTMVQESKRVARFVDALETDRVGSVRVRKSPAPIDAL